MLKFFLVFTLLIGVFFSLQAQYTVKGRATDSSSHTSIGFVSVSLRVARDSAFVTGSMADSTGRFELSGIPAGQYSLQVSSLGYRTHVRPLVIPDQPGDIQLGVIVMGQDSKQLGEVTVRGEKAAIQYDSDKMVLNVAANSLFKTSTNVLDILRKAPGVTVNPDGTLLLSGRNTPVIFINGKSIEMSPEELQAYLNGLPPDGIEAIEIISNPTSKYDAQYKGIIDIKLKGDQSLGWKGTISSSFRQNIYSSADNNLNLSYRTKKVTYALRAGCVVGDDFYQYKALQHLANTNYMATHTQTRTANNNLALQLGIDYALKKNQRLEFSLKTYQANRNLHAFNTLTFTGSPQNDILGISQTTNRSTPIQRTYAVNAGYDVQFRNSNRLAIFGSVTNISNRQKEDIQIRDQLMDELMSYWKTSLKNDILIRNIQADFTKIMKKGVLEAGGKFAFITTDNDLQYDTLTRDNIFAPDAGRTNKFVYGEYISAGYVSYDYKDTKFNVKLSVRAEHTHTVANAVTQNEVLKRDYLTWLPGASVSYVINTDERFSFAFTRRMTRPDFSQLNPFRFYLSPLNYRVGNPYLRPSVISSFNLAYMYKDYSIALTAGQEKDMMTRYPEYNRITNELLYLGMNLLYNNFANIESGYTFSIASWWKTMHTIGVYYNKQQMPYLGKTYAIGVIDYAITGSQVFTLPKGIAADLTYRYKSKSGNSLYRSKAFGSLDVGIQKSWWQGKLNTKMNFYDLFYSHAISYVFREKTIIDNQFSHRFRTRRVALTLAYNFGKANYKTRQNRTSEEESRAGN
jgi:hypothetical protein